MCCVHASEYETMPFFWGKTVTQEVYKLARYYLAVGRLRPETYSLECNLQHIVQTRGDLVEVNHDITALVRAVDALTASEKRFRDVSHAAGEYIWETDDEGRYTFLTERVRGVLGYGPEELIGRKPIELMPEEDRQRVVAFFDAQEPGDGFTRLEHQSTTKTGGTIWQSVSGVPIFDADKRPVGYRGTGEDITERQL